MTNLFQNYGKRININFISGKDEFLYDEHNQEYLDFISGISVLNLGHNNTDINKAFLAQAQKLTHISNLFEIQGQEDVAGLIIQALGGDYKGLFCNSGAEANEAAIKLATKATKRKKLLSFKNSFHGRTLATLSATGQDKVKQGFFPLSKRMLHAPYNEINGLEKYFDDDLSAVIVEVLQAEGGVTSAKEDFLKKLEELCKKNKSLLIIDEVQTGFGRLGTEFGFKQYDISPDIITMAKALGNGYPMGAMFAKSEYKDFFNAGSHGTTFGGSPLAMSVARVVCETIFHADFLQSVQKKSQLIQEEIKNKLENNKNIISINIVGLMIGLKLADNINVQDVIKNLREKHHFLCLPASNNTLRLLPPLIVSEKNITKAIDYIQDVLA